MLRLYIFVLCICVTVVTRNDEDRRVKKANMVRKMKKFKHEGAVRLVGSSSHNTGGGGNVEVFDGRGWGSVCDDEWDMDDGAVVCRQLHKGPPLAVTHNSYFGPPHSKYFMDNVRCSGNEGKLSECRFDGWYRHDCQADEAAGVICAEEESSRETTSPLPSALPPPRYKLHNILGEDTKIRLKGGRVSSEGRVEIRTANNTEWSTICGEGWSLLEALVVCRQTGLGYAQMATQNAFISSEEVLQVGLSNVQCRGNETNLRDCTITLDQALRHGECSSDNVAGVICTHYLADLVVDFREIAQSAYLEDRPLYLLQCAMEENCLASGAYTAAENSHNWHLETRRLLRFTASILNAGNAEFRPASPKHLWEFHQCHMHYHSMEVFATFDVYRGKEKVAEGHKASFCLEDNRCLTGVEPTFACANYGDQGISVNCSDIYRHNIDCQWVDITDILPGIYTLKVAINPEFKVAEMSFENNAALCMMYYGTSSVHISDCHLDRP